MKYKMSLAIDDHFEIDLWLAFSDYYHGTLIGTLQYLDLFFQMKSLGRGCEVVFHPATTSPNTRHNPANKSRHIENNIKLKCYKFRETKKQLISKCPSITMLQ